jgi:hypothetical protein
MEGAIENQKCGRKLPLAGIRMSCSLLAIRPQGLRPVASPVLDWKARYISAQRRGEQSFVEAIANTSHYPWELFHVVPVVYCCLLSHIPLFYFLILRIKAKAQRRVNFFFCILWKDPIGSRLENLLSHSTAYPPKSSRYKCGIGSPALGEKVSPISYYRSPWH